MVSSSSTSNPHVLSGGATSGLTINLHPLPILNISEVHNRATHTHKEPPKLIGALLGTEANREISITNSFELTYRPLGAAGEDVDMGGEGSGTRAKYVLDSEFLETRKDQFKQVFPTLEVVGWYSVGDEPTADDVALHEQFTSTIDTPIFLLFHPTIVPGTQSLPLTVYESAVPSDGAEASEEGKFVKIEYGIETGEAERIAVDGVARGGMGGEGEEGTAVAHLTTQRNAIKMLYDRIDILLQYVSGVINSSTKPDHTILRQISALVATLPVMDAQQFQEELSTEYSDVQLSAYLTTLTKQLSALSDYADKHGSIHSQSHEEHGLRHHGDSRGHRGFGMGGIFTEGSGRRAGRK
ncbi:hypothetical protein IAT38_003578 [Cryptococcus sp. DSM 104549]